MNFVLQLFKAPEAIKRVERFVQLSTDRGVWIRIGTFVVGSALVAGGAYVLLRKPINAVTGATTKAATKIVKAVV